MPHQRGLSHLDLLLQARQDYSDDYIDIVGFFDDEFRTLFMIFLFLGFTRSLGAPIIATHP